LRKLHEIIQSLQDNETPTPRALRVALLDTLPYLVDARNKIVGLGGSGELESMGDALVNTGIATDLSKVTVNEGEAFKSAIAWRQYAYELELKLVDSGFTVHSIASDDDRTDPPTQEEIDEVEDIAAEDQKVPSAEVPCQTEPTPQL
jgi:hypothetical protein